MMQLVCVGAVNAVGLLNADKERKSDAGANDASWVS